MALYTPDTKKFLDAALEEARISVAEGGIPIGAVLVENDTIIARGHNRRIQDGDPTAHAEIECLRNAGRRSSYSGLVLYSTLMPCHMCAGAIVQFGIEYVVAGESTNFKGATTFLQDHWVQVERAESDACISILHEFITAHPDLWNEDIGR